MKKLKLRIAKFDRMLIVEQLELEGEFKKTDHVEVFGNLCISKAGIDLKEDDCKGSVNVSYFKNNEKRDEYAANLIEWITEEQFGGSGKLEVGKMCEVSDDGEEWGNRIFAGKSAKQLGEEKRFLAVHLNNKNSLVRWKYAKPINDCLKIDGEIYTWEGDHE